MSKKECTNYPEPKSKVSITCGPPVPIAEILLNILKVVRQKPGVVVLVDKDDMDVIGMAFARIKLAQDMEKRGKSFTLRALVEEWDPFRMVREVY